MSSLIRNSQFAIRNFRAFTLIEVMVVVAMLALIVLALMAVFNGTQVAFRSGVTQTGVQESGRAVMGLIRSDLEEMTPSYNTNDNNTFQTLENFYAGNMSSFNQPLVGGSAVRTNVMEDVFILSRDNQTWTGIGYFVRTNLSTPIPTQTGIVGTLYRFETNYSVAQFEANPRGLWDAFMDARDGNDPTDGISKLMDGVMDFKVRAFDTNGFWITNTYTYSSSNIVAVYDPVLNEASYRFYSNAVPAFVEVELGVLEDSALQRAESLPEAAQTNFLAGSVGQVHLFRQRVWIRNMDPAAYQ